MNHQRYAEEVAAGMHEAKGKVKAEVRAEDRAEAPKAKRGKAAKDDGGALKLLDRLLFRLWRPWVVGTFSRMSSPWRRENMPQVDRSHVSYLMLSVRRVSGQYIIERICSNQIDIGG